MKYIYLILAVFLITSCNESQITDNTTPEVDLMEIAKQIGKEHNIILNEVSKKLKAEKHLSFDVIDNITFEATVDYAMSNNVNNIDVETIRTFTRDGMNIGRRTNLVSKKGPKATIIEISNVGDALTEIEIKYLDLLNTVVQDYSQNNQLFDKEIGVLEQQLEQHEVAEIINILIALEIAKNSREYWVNNLGEWIALAAKSGNKSKFNDSMVSRMDWGDVVLSDIAGGIGAAVTTGVINVVPGAGQVAYGGAIAAGSAGASAINLTYQVFSRWF